MPRNLPPLSPFLAASVFVWPAVACGGPPDAYDDAVRRAHDAETSGDYAAATRVLRAVVDAYEQDYAIALELGWAYAQAGDRPMAERAYRVALHRAPASTDARLGLAWALVLEERCGDALDTAASLVGDAARAVTERCAPATAPRGVDAYAAFDAYAFTNDPAKATGLGVLAGLAGRSARGWTAGAAYRHTAFTPPAGAPTSGFDQDEAYARAGYERPLGGLQVEGAVVHDGSGLLGLSEHVGVSGRWSPAGDLVADGSLSFYRDELIPRLALTWSLPVVGWLRVVPGVAAQDASGQALGNASLAAVVRASWASAWVGVKYGDEVRPAYLAAQIVYDIPSRVRWGTWAGARVRAAGPVWLFATYAFDRLQRNDTTPPAYGDAHALVTGASVDL